MFFKSCIVRQMFFLWYCCLLVFGLLLLFCSCLCYTPFLLCCVLTGLMCKSYYFDDFFNINVCLHHQPRYEKTVCTMYLIFVTFVNNSIICVYLTSSLYNIRQILRFYLLSIIKGELEYAVRNLNIIYSCVRQCILQSPFKCHHNIVEPFSTTMTGTLHSDIEIITPLFLTRSGRRYSQDPAV